MSEFPSTLNPERTKLYEQIATLVAGNRSADVFCALGDNLAQAAAFLTNTPDEAEALIRDCIPDLMRTIRENWDLIVEAKANPIYRKSYHV